MPLWLSEADVRASLTMPAVMQAMEAALAAFSAGRVVQPVRTAFELRERAFFGLMPAYDREQAILGAKLVSVILENAARALPTHLAAISLFDPETGALIAVMDGRLITEMRTAAVSALSVKYLARRGATVLAILGSGVQARSHVEALPLAIPFEEMRAWSPNAEHLAEFADETGVRAACSAEEAVRDADVVVLATNSVTPAIDNGWVKAGAHAIAIGACRPSQREIDPDLVARARLVVDSRDAALQESGDVVQAIREGRITAGHAHVELGEVIAGTKPGRRSEEEVTLFKSLGLAVEDLATAALAYRLATAAGRGVKVEL
jgi:ornithine cyclodeaminase/alanine dehydrogenase-like protein (mu-crystallin family)